MATKAGSQQQRWQQRQTAGNRGRLPATRADLQQQSQTPTTEANLWQQRQQQGQTAGNKDRTLTTKADHQQQRPTPSNRCTPLATKAVTKADCQQQRQTASNEGRPLATETDLRQQKLSLEILKIKSNM